MNKQEFLLGKAQNFRTYLQQYHPAPEVQKYLDAFEPSLLTPTLLTVVLPIVRSNATASAVKDLMKNLQIPDGQAEAVRDKLTRYLEMFAAVVSE